MESHNNLRTLYKIGGVTALLQLTTVVGLIVISFTMGPRPTGVQEFFDLYQQNKLVGLVQDDFTSLLLIVLYMGTYPALFYALRRVNFAWATLATLFTFVAVAICASTQASFSLMHLSDLYAAASTEAQRALYLAAGEAVLASDMWNSSGAYLSGILLQGGGVIISLVMLRSKQFSKVTVISGLLGNGLDLVQHLLHPFAPSISASLQMVMGPFYLVWFPMLARDLFRFKEDL